VTGSAPLNDKYRLAAAFHDLTSLGYGALLRAGFTAQDALERVREHFPTCDHWVYYTDQGELPSFDANGNLGCELRLYWRGSAQVITQTLRRRGLHATQPPPTETIAVAANPRAVATTFHDRCADCGRRYGNATGKPASPDNVYADMTGHAAAFRTWVSENDPATFTLMEQDLALCPHDDVYERYVGFGLPEHRSLGSSDGQ
jgi:hypothetical protein